jgi:hypothetical protein
MILEEDLRQARHRRPGFYDDVATTLLGCSISSADASVLEDQLQDDPSVRPARLKLIGYYFDRSAKSSAPGDDANAEAQRARHVTWFIREVPTDSILLSPFATFSDDSPVYAEVRGALLEAVEDTNASRELLEGAAWLLCVNEMDEPIANSLWDRARNSV